MNPAISKTSLSLVLGASAVLSIGKVNNSKPNHPHNVSVQQDAINPIFALPSGQVWAGAGVACTYYGAGNAASYFCTIWGAAQSIAIGCVCPPAGIIYAC